MPAGGTVRCCSRSAPADPRDDRGRRLEEIGVVRRRPEHRRRSGFPSPPRARRRARARRRPCSTCTPVRRTVPAAVRSSRRRRPPRAHARAAPRRAPVAAIAGAMRVPHHSPVARPPRARPRADASLRRPTGAAGCQSAGAPPRCRSSDSGEPPSDSVRMRTSVIALARRGRWPRRTCRLRCSEQSRTWHKGSPEPPRGAWSAIEASFVVGLPASDRAGPVQLLGEHQARELVRQRPRRKLERARGRAPDARRPRPYAPPITNATSRAASRAPLQPVRELRRGQTIAALVAGEHQRALGQTLDAGARLRAAHELGGAHPASRSPRGPRRRRAASTAPRASRTPGSPPPGADRAACRRRRRSRRTQRYA